MTTTTTATLDEQIADIRAQVAMFEGKIAAEMAKLGHLPNVESNWMRRNRIQCDINWYNAWLTPLRERLRVAEARRDELEAADACYPLSYDVDDV